MVYHLILHTQTIFSVLSDLISEQIPLPVHMEEILSRSYQFRYLLLLRLLCHQLGQDAPKLFHQSYVANLSILSIPFCMSGKVQMEYFLVFHQILQIFPN